MASNEFIFEQIQSKELNTKVPDTKNPDIPEILPILPIEKKTDFNDSCSEFEIPNLKSKEMLNR